MKHFHPFLPCYPVLVVLNLGSYTVYPNVALFKANQALPYHRQQGLVLIIINTCVELGVFDAVSPEVPASAGDIAAKVGIDASILCKSLYPPISCVIFLISN